jgi:DNA-binding NtrC family response regulator
MPSAARRRLLVVDDDPKIRELFTDFFKDRFDIDSAANGEDGLAAMRRQRPDLVLLDINMPGISGLDVLKDIKRLDQRLPVIMVTANTEIAAAEEALKSGAFAYLPKPFQLAYADHLVAAALSETSRR